MEKLLKILKPRFSYFLLSGLLGYFLVVGGYVAFNSGKLTPNNIMSGAKSNFIKYVSPLYLVIFGALLVVLMGVGYFLCAKKEQTEVKVGSIILMASEGLLSLSNIIYLIIAHAMRKRLLMSKNIGITYSFNSINLVLIIVSFIAYGVITYGVLKTKKMDRLGKVGGYIGVGFVGLFVIYSLFFFLTSFFTKSINDLMYLYVSSEGYPYQNTVYSIHFFSLTQLNSLLIQIQDISVTKVTNTFPFVISYLYQFIYLLGLGGVIVSLGINVIESFDIKYDSDRMSI